MGRTDKDEAKAVEEENTERYLAGLEHELAGYRRAGNTDRAGQVEAEIRRCGGAVPSDKPKGRRAPKKETATIPDATIPDGTVDEVLDWVDEIDDVEGEDSVRHERAQAALAAETAKGDKARSTLVTSLEETIDEYAEKPKGHGRIGSN